MFHYFKAELDRETVTVGEFAQALEKALQGLGLTLFAEKCAVGGCGGTTLEANLAHLARDYAFSLELFLFPRLRDQKRTQLGHAPRVLRFYWPARLRKTTHAGAPALEFPLRTN